MDRVSPGDLPPFPPDVSIRSILGYNYKMDFGCCGNIQGSSFSPMCYLRSQLGVRSKADRYFGNFQRKVIQKRVRNMRISWRHRIPFMPSNAAGIFCMDVDPVDQRYLLCGSCNGILSIVDLEMPLPANSALPVEHSVVSSNNRLDHRFLITKCQWYPQDTSMFLSSSMDRTVKLWDANNMKVVDEYGFKEPVTQFHWSNVPSQRPLIAIANLTSNIELIDPRAGEAIQNLRWKTEYVTAVRWSPEQENYLLTGGKCGNVTLWDVRSAKSQLKTLCAPLENAHAAPVGGMRFSEDGIYVVTISIDRVIRIWRAHNMELVNTVKLDSEMGKTPASNPTIHFDLITSDGVLRACIPDGDEILVPTLEHSFNSYRNLLVGHFSYVNSCVYRSAYHQVISSSNDRMILIWSPDMDEILPDQASAIVERLQQDEWSDDE